MKRRKAVWGGAVALLLTIIWGTPVQAQGLLGNYSGVAKDVLAEAQTQVVPAEREEEAKAQVTRLVTWRIFQSDPNVGLLSKPGGNQVMGLSVDVLMNRLDGSWADMATATRNGVPPGMVRVEPVWIPHGPDTTAAWLSRWVQPTAALAAAPGPLTFGRPDPVPPPTQPIPHIPESVLDLSGVQAQLDAISTKIDMMRTESGDAHAAIHQNITDARAENRSFFSTIGQHWRSVVAVVGPAVSWYVAKRTGGDAK